MAMPKLAHDLDELAGTFPDLPRAEGFDNVAGYLNDKAEEEAQRARAARITR